MATYSRVKTFVANETLTASDLNTEFNNIITNTNSGNLNSDNVSTSAAWTWTGYHTYSTSSRIVLADNIYMTLGNATDGDYRLRYNSSNTALELTSTNSDGSGTDAVVMDVQDGTDDVRIRGGLSTNNNAAPTSGIVTGGNIVSDTDGTDDLGTTSVRWANLYVDAATITNNLTVGGTLTLTGGLTLNGNVTVGDNASDTLTINSTITSNLIFTDATYDIGASGATRPRDLHLSRNALMGGTLDVTGLLTATAGVTSGSNIVSDTDSTDDLGTTSLRWANLYVDSIGDTGQALAITAGSNNVNVTAGTLALTGAQTISSTLTATGATTIGAGQAVNAKALLTLTSTTSAGYGGEIQFHKNSASTAEIGNESAVLGSGTSSDLFLASDGAIDFATGGTTQRMTITTGGDLGIGTASPLGDSKIHTVTGTASSYTPAGNTQAIFEHTAASDSIARVGIIAGQGTGFSVLDFGDSTGPTNGGITYKHETDEMFFATTNGTTKMSIQSGTEVWIANTSDQGAYNLQVGGTGVWGAGAYVNGSDEKIKQSITTYDDDATALVSQMRPVTFEYTEEYSRDRAIQVGFIAQDLQKVLEGKNYADGIVKEDSNNLNVAYQSIIPILTKAIQELTQRVKELENN